MAWKIRRKSYSFSPVSHLILSSFFPFFPVKRENGWNGIFSFLGRIPEKKGVTFLLSYFFPGLLFGCQGDAVWWLSKRKLSCQCPPILRRHVSNEYKVDTFGATFVVKKKFLFCCLFQKEDIFKLNPYLLLHPNLTTNFTNEMKKYTDKVVLPGVARPGDCGIKP